MDATVPMEGMPPAPKPYKTCGAKNRQGLPCAKRPLRGRERCKNHGGASPVGRAHPNFKTGRWSRYLPQGLTQLYETAQADPFSKSHGPDLHLIDTKIADLLRGIDDGNPGEKLSQVQRIWGRLRKAQRTNNDLGIRRCISELNDLLSGPNMQASWEEIYQCMDLRRKTLEAEQKRLKDAQQMISIEELLILTHFLSDSIKTSVMKYADSTSARSIILDITRDLTLCMSRYAGPRSQRPDSESPNLLA